MHKPPWKVDDVCLTEFLGKWRYFHIRKIMEGRALLQAVDRYSGERQHPRTIRRLDVLQPPAFLSSEDSGKLIEMVAQEMAVAAHMNWSTLSQADQSWYLSMANIAYDILARELGRQGEQV